jgi:hypothetical protein
LVFDPVTSRANQLSFLSPFFCSILYSLEAARAACISLSLSFLFPNPPGGLQRGLQHTCVFSAARTALFLSFFACCETRKYAQKAEFGDYNVETRD